MTFLFSPEMTAFVLRKTPYISAQKPLKKKRGWGFPQLCNAKEHHVYTLMNGKQVARAGPRMNENG